MRIKEKYFLWYNNENIYKRISMKKLTTLALSLTAVLFMGTTTLSASDAKCGAGKCGGVKQETPAMKCGGAQQAPVTKCGGAQQQAPATKCGGKKEEAPAMKCGAGKCGGAKQETPAMKCGSGKM